MGPMTRKLIAEIGSCNGDLPLAIDTALAALDAGATWVKGQMYQADTLTTKHARTYGKDLNEPATQWEAFDHALTYDEWHIVAEVCEGQFFASVFDLEGCDGYPYKQIKIASADINHRALIEAAAGTGKQLILSTGAASWRDIHRALSWIPGTHPILLACTLAYPCPPRDANVKRVVTLRDFNLEVGYSDHTRGVVAAHLAYDLGACVVEKHFTIRPGTGGDNDFAIGPDMVRQIVQRVDPMSEAVLMVLGGSEVLGVRASELSALYAARRSPYATEDIKAGHSVDAGNTVMLRPAAGVEPWRIPLEACVDIRAGDCISDGLAR